MPNIIGIVVSSKLATLHEIDTVYGTEDLYDFLEIISVDAYNKNIAMKASQNGQSN